jgi:DNA-binding MarR family transcriptional regulator
MEDFDLTRFLPYRLAVAAARVSRGLARHYADFGLTIPEWRVLAHLAGGGALSVKDITARVDMDKSKVSRAATRLVAAGYLTKTIDPGDGRLVAMALTPAGRALLARIVPLALTYEAEVVAELGVDAAGLMAALTRLEGGGGLHPPYGAGDDDPL